jgi:PmbA protein
MEPRAATEFVRSLAREYHEKEVDLVLERSESISVRVFRGRVERVEQETDRGLGIRVVKDGRTGLAYTERLEPAALERTFANARENAALQDPTEVLIPDWPGTVPDPAALQLYNPALEKLEVKDLADVALEVERRALAGDKRVKTVSSLGAFRGTSEHRLVSLSGAEHVRRENSAGAYCQVLLEEGARRKSGSHMWSRRAWDADAALQVGDEALHRAQGLIGATSIPGGEFPVVLDEYCAPRLLSIYFGAFSAEAAQKGQSRLKGRLGEKIAIDGLSLLDDPHRPGARGSRFLDDEGVPTRPMPLVENGVFSNFLYHVESARKEGKASTGHATRGYQGSVSTGWHSMVMPTGTHSLEQLIAIPEKCLLVTELEGAAGCRPLSGDISIGVQGYWVEQGRRVHPVDSLTIAGNYYNLLKSIRAVGDRYQPNLTKHFIPALLIEGLAVSS